MYSHQFVAGPNAQLQAVQTSFLGYVPARLQRTIVGFNKPPRRSLFTCIKCEKKDDDEAMRKAEHDKLMRKAEHDKAMRKAQENTPAFGYIDSLSGQMTHFNSNRSSIPGPDYWPEGTANQVRADSAPVPTGESEGSPSFGKLPGSRRKYKTSAAASESSDTSDVASTKSNLDDGEPSEMSVDASTESSESSLDAREPSGFNIGAPESFDVIVKSSEHVGGESSEDAIEEPKDISSEYVVYQTEPELSGYDLDKKLGRPHPFNNPNTKKDIGEPLENEELWWQWKKPKHDIWSRWQRRRPDVETVFLKAMAETGQIKLYGKEPTLTECALYRARRHIFKEERIQAEREKQRRIGPMAYYSQWVKAWKRDTSLEAVQKHYEETGETIHRQLLDMFSFQTEREYKIMRGMDIQVRRDPLAMQLREDQIKEIWGGDPVYPTINYIQDPKQVIDYRGPNYHEPVPNIEALLMEKGIMITSEKLDEILASERPEEPQEVEDDDAMVNAIDIGEDDEEDDGDDDKTEANVLVDIGETEVGDDSDGSDADAGAEDEKLTHGWSILKSTPELQKSKGKRKPKNDNMSLAEAVEDSENLTDFLLDFDEDN